MSIIQELRGKKPKWGKNCLIAPNASLIGDVTMGDDCSIWYNAVLRGDVCDIVMGDAVNIQDNAIIHGTFEKSRVKIGHQVSVGHRAIVHGCEIHDHVLIGMGSIVMDNAVIEEGSIVAAGAIILEGTRVPSGTIFAGVPARQVKEIPKNKMIAINKETADHYVHYIDWYK